MEGNRKWFWLFAAELDAARASADLGQLTITFLRLKSAEETLKNWQRAESLAAESKAEELKRAQQIKAEELQPAAQP